ncbi:MAG: hypothetical protein ACFFBD_21470 [Candidatus Hodarchaeota archaeon]
MRSTTLVERQDGKFFLCIVVEKEVGELDPSICDQAVGVDVGMNFIAVTSDTANKTLFYGGGRVKYTRWKYFKLR